MKATKQLEDAVFYAAQSVADPFQRKLFLDQACAGNPELRAVAEELLAAQADAERFFAKASPESVLFPAAMRPSISSKQTAAPGS
jgi:hypothetical protein